MFVPMPPRLAVWIAGLRLPRDRREFVLGDLEEEFAARMVPALGVSRARRWFWRQALMCLLTRSPRSGCPRAPRRERTFPMRDLVRDVQFALRLFRGAPAFTVSVLFTLALGIGATTAMFSVVYAVLLKPLPFTDPGSLVYVRDGRTAEEAVNVSFPEFADWRRDVRGVAPMGAYFQRSVALTRLGEPEQLFGAGVSAGLLPMLGVDPILGRSFTPEEEQRTAARVAMVGASFWRRKLGGAADALGQTITLNGDPYAVVGVLPDWFRSVRPSDTAGGTTFDIWTPLRLDERVAPRSLHFLRVVGRLAPGWTLEQAADELSASLARAAPGADPPPRAIALPFRRTLVSASAQPLLLLLGAVGVLLLVICANLANLWLARSETRRHELAVRVALGAARWRIVRQMLTESALLGLAGGLGGVAIAWCVVRLFAEHDSVSRAGAYDLRLDPAVLAFAVATSLATGLLFGLMPARQAGRAAPAGLLRSGSRATSGTGGLRSALVVAELALTVILLMGAGLLVRSFANLLAAPAGFDPHGVVAFGMGAAQTAADGPAQTRYFSEILDRIQGLPSVHSAGVINELPLGGGGVSGGTPIDGRIFPPGEAPRAEKRIVSPGYFTAMGVPLLRGRTFAESDDERAPPVMVVNGTFAKRYFSGEDPIGQRVSFAWDLEGSQEIVGVVADVKHYGLDDEPPAMVYVSFRQRPIGFAVAVVKGRSPERAGLVADVRRAVHAIDPDQPLGRLRSMDDVVSESVATRRLLLTIAGAFAALGLVLAITGVYGVVSHLTRRRSHEFGIRLALGADAPSLVRLVVAGTLWIVLAGLGLGAGGAWLVTGLIAAELYGVAPTDPATFATVGAGLGVVALLAAYLPARRAGRVDPIRTLRDS